MVFIKRGPATALPMFEAEVDGLEALRATNTVRVPDVLACDVKDGESYIALERLSLERPTTETERRFGLQLAALHRHTEVRFGWSRDNTIGLTPQKNEWCTSWIEFFDKRRLKYQAKLACASGYRGDIESLVAQLSERLPTLFKGYEPAASLLHGDLWAGNWGSVNGQPVVFDPAVYYGDRETDIAMTRLFGGFGQRFYSAYEESWPLAPGHEQRVKLYQLYHVLNHLNLFGVGYLSHAMSLLRDLVSIE